MKKEVDLYNKKIDRNRVEKTLQQQVIGHFY